MANTKFLIIHNKVVDNKEDVYKIWGGGIFR